MGFLSARLKEKASQSEGKIKFWDVAPNLSMRIITVLGAIAVAILLFFGFIFALATNYWPTGLAVSAMLFLASFGIIYFIARKPTTIVQKFEVSGEMKAVSIKCPNCGASINANAIKMVSGVPYATCPYCNNTFEVVEEPKW